MAIKMHHVTLANEATDRFPEYSLESLGLARQPLNAVVQVLTGPGTSAYQAIEVPDAPDIGLDGYRSGAVREIRAHLDKNIPLIALIGPSRSLKTEAVLNGCGIMHGGQFNYFIPPQSTLRLLEGVVHLNLQALGRITGEQLILEYEDAREEFQDRSKGAVPRVVVIDEFDTSHPGAADLINYLGEAQTPVVIAFGGRASNALKKTLLHDFMPGITSPQAAIVEISVKPLNARQIGEMTEVCISTGWTEHQESARAFAARVGALATDIPVTFFGLERLMADTVLAEGLPGTFKMGRLIGAELSVALSLDMSDTELSRALWSIANHDDCGTFVHVPSVPPQNPW